MFKISIIDTPRERTLVVEGTLIAPWTAELQTVWRNAGQELQRRKLAVDLTNVTVISQEGENTLFELMRNGAKFSSGGVLTRHVLSQLARRCHNTVRDADGYPNNQKNERR
jgi:hypothetical protein